MATVSSIHDELEIKLTAAPTLPPVTTLQDCGPVILVSKRPTPPLRESIMAHTLLTGEECVVVRDELELFDYLSTVDQIGETPLAMITLDAELSRWSVALLDSHPVLCRVPRLTCAPATARVTTPDDTIALLQQRSAERDHSSIESAFAAENHVSGEPSVVLARLSADLRADAEDAVLAAAAAV